MLSQKIKEILESGAKPNSFRFEPEGETLLCYVIKRSDTDPEDALKAVTMLLNSGADPEIANKNGQFPLYFAAKMCQWQIGKLLLAHHANPNRTYQRDKLGNIAFTYEKLAVTKIKRRERLSKILPHTGLFNKKTSSYTQKELLALSTALGYKSTKKGICHAVTMMIIQASLIEGGLDTLQCRFQKIYNHSVEQLIEFINLAKEKRNQLYLSAKSKYSHLYSNASESVIDAELDRLDKEDNQAKYKLLPLQKKLAKLISIKANEDVCAQLTEDEKNDIEIEAFFDDVEVHQLSCDKDIGNFQIKRNLPDVDENMVHTMNDVATTSSFMLGDNQSYICQSNGLYSKDEVKTYFKSLREELRKYHQQIAGLNEKIQSFSPPLAISIHSSNHAIAILYDFDRDKWMFADVNKFRSDRRFGWPVINWISSESVLADNIVESLFSDNESYVEFAASFYSRSDQAKLIFESINEWKKSDEYRKLHAVTLEHSKRKTKTKKSWMDFVRTKRDYKTLDKLDKISNDHSSYGLLLTVCLSLLLTDLFLFGILIAVPVSLPIVLPLALVVLGATLGWFGDLGRNNWVKRINVKKSETDPEIANPAEDKRWDHEKELVVNESQAAIQDVLQQESTVQVSKPSAISMFAKRGKHQELHVNNALYEAGFLHSCRKPT